MIRADRLAALRAQEEARYRRRHPRSAALAAQSAPHWLYGLPLHWMRDWPLPHPLFVERAQGAELFTVDGHRLADFCLGDSAAMYGHAPPALAAALSAQASRGLTAMLPGEPLAEVGAALARTFGLPRWQLALSASDANRFVLRWARAVTGRPRVLVFDGCYHGTVDDTLVDLRGDGRTVARASLLGQVHDLAAGTVAVPFNDLAAVEAALAAGDVAAVLTEPALTNCGLVPPAPGFIDGVQAVCRRHGTLLVLDETHTLSTGHGGWARVHGLVPDVLVVGKAVAGGVPCAVYGFGDELADRMARAKAAAPEGHSGIGTTLSASLLALAALRATLAQVMTPAAHAAMERGAARLAAGLEAVIAGAGLPWCITRLGARMELQFRATPPRDAGQARAAMDPVLESALHLFWLNRGILVTPFHGMLLVPPMAAGADLDAVPAALSAFLEALR
ncbi:MAG: aspartate aminotransferase family protein [Rubrivivax sp.]